MLTMKLFYQLSQAACTLHDALHSLDHEGSMMRARPLVRTRPLITVHDNYSSSSLSGYAADTLRPAYMSSGLSRFGGIAETHTRQAICLVWVPASPMSYLEPAPPPRAFAVEGFSSVPVAFGLACRFVLSLSSLTELIGLLQRGADGPARSSF